MPGEYYDPDVPMCVSCELDECDPRHCYRVTSRILTGQVKAPANIRVPIRAPKVAKATQKPKFSTPIKKKYWDMKIQDHIRDGYFIEYKNQNNYWNPRIKRLLDQLPCKGVFLVGKEPHRVLILEINEVVPEYIPERYAGEITTPMAWELKCEWVYE